MIAQPPAGHPGLLHPTPSRGVEHLLRRSDVLGLWLTLAGISMMFAAFTSAYVFRHGVSAAWPVIPPPKLTAFNTFLLLLSSAVLEGARRLANSGRTRAGRGLLALAALLGFAFLAGQCIAWRQLARQGITLDTNPHSSFFYMLSGVHGVHAAGGVSALLWLSGRACLRKAEWPFHAVGLAAVYWHFVGALWVYLVVLLFL
ncbi:MAG: cytochrome c oxidase subunit 3 [Planctomycetes bacterium]|nr:cytochrome c oxidase subunit 3 [Planctomycetota bacterium]